MRRHNRRVYRTVRAILGRDADAEDAMQDTYVQAFRGLGGFEARARFATWLTRIAVREALARKKKRIRDEGRETAEQSFEEERAMPTIGIHAGSPEDRASGGEIRRVIEAGIDTLPEHFRTVFVLRAVEELSVAETAACLELQEETVKTRLHRARGMLQEYLLERADQAAAGAYPFHAPRCDRVVARVLAALADEGMSS